MNTLKFDELNHLISRTSDSRIISYSIVNGKIAITILLNDDSLITVCFKTSLALFEEISNSEMDNIGHFELISIKSFLDIKNGIYTSPADNISLLKIRRRNIHLAIGFNAKDSDYIINYTGYRNIVSFLIKSNDLITVIEE